MRLLKIIAVLDWLLDPQKIDFLVNIAATWPDFGPQDDPKLGSQIRKKNRSKNHLRSELGSGAAFGPILGPSWADLDRFWDQFCLLLGRFFVEF